MLRTVRCVVGIAPCVVACATGQAGPPAVGEAVVAVEAFVAAETSGNWRSDAVRVYGCEDGFQPTSDTMYPVSSAGVLGGQTAGDTVLVEVEYRVLGHAYIGDRHSSFSGGVRVEKVQFRVVRDTTDEVRIFCGPHPANHPGFGAMRRFISTFDPESLSQWEDALVVARERGWPVPSP